MKRELAETVALQALGWIAGDERLGPLFLSSSGLDPADLRARAGEPEVLVAVLQFLTQDDGWVRSFCDATDYRYEDPLRALHALPGGAPVHWT